MVDILEANAIKFTETFRYPQKKIFGTNFKRGLLYGIINYIQALFLSPFRYPLGYKKIMREHRDVLFLYCTINQYRALNGVCAYLKERGVEVGEVQVKDLPLWKAYLYGSFRAVSLLKCYKELDKEKRLIVNNSFSDFLLTFGIEHLLKEFLNKFKIRSIVLANDISPYMRTALLLSPELNVSTYYVQHAAVTCKFPKLISTYSFLDGLDSYNKYLQDKDCDSEKVYLIGGARFDAAKVVRDSRESKTLGVALTLRDKKEKWESLIDGLKKELVGTKIIVRPHPRMNLAEIKAYCKEAGILFSDSKKEDSFCFLNKIDLLIANETSIHLDAIVMHVNTVLYAGLSDSDLRDHYGMIKSRLLSYSTELDELIAYIKAPNKFIPSEEAVRMYNASYNTPFEYKVSYAIASIIYKQLKGLEPIIDGMTYDNGVVTIDYAR